jgi:hypothetical protein
MLDGITGMDALAGLKVDDRPTAAGLYAGYRRSAMVGGRDRRRDSSRG